MIYIFDVDGTLTPSRETIFPEFANWFSWWMLSEQSQGNKVMLVTGSDRTKTQEQLGEKILSRIDYCFNCMGNTVYKGQELVYDYKLEEPETLKEFLELCLGRSTYPSRYGNHIEHRGSMINFSVVGRNAVGQQRTHYYEWDKVNHERAAIADQICNLFGQQGLTATVGGETGIDISAVGRDKSQVMSYIDQPTVFFGDRIDPSGNDWSLAKALEADARFKHKIVPVQNWKQTWNVLKMPNN